ncbi:MAG: cellulase family glycosylhydrolase, partial [Candidatus Eremiobacteraeota bacterium]|nr:cellulase family glycosylhydrolase [Candidatus Eremiobacteraeota bacterium]
PGVFDQSWFHTPDLEATLLDRWEKGFAYLSEQGLAPVLVGEFGGREVGTDTLEGRWQNLFVDFLAERGYSWTYWSWNPNSSDTGGILADDWRTAHADKQAMLDRALAVAASPPPTTTSSAPPSSVTTTAPTTATSTTATTVVAGGLTASYAVTSDWGSGYCAEVSITNGTGATVTTAGLRFELAGATITATWNGEHT